jgi:hypothetical protein
MKTTIIDGRGLARDGFSSLPRSKLRSFTGSQLSDHAVKDRGFVVLRRDGFRSVEVRYRPSIVKPRALLKTVEVLTDHDSDRFALNSWIADWQTSVFGNRTTAIRHLIALPTAAQNTRQQDFQARRHAPASIVTDPAFGRIQDAWCAARGVKDQRLMEAVREASCGRYLEVIPQSGAERLVMDAVGEGYSLYGNGWKAVAIGGRFEDMPDYEYAQSAAQAYREAFRTGQPIFEDVTAVVKLLRSGRLLLTYRRAILPIGGGEYPALLLGATLNQRVTHLPLEPSDEFGDVLQ